MLQLAEISTAATYVGMVIWEWCCVIIASLYVYFVDQCLPYILFEIIFILVYIYTKGQPLVEKKRESQP